MWEDHAVVIEGGVDTAGSLGPEPDAQLQQKWSQMLYI